MYNYLRTYMLHIIKRFFKKKQKIPEEYMRMVHTEFPYVPCEYVEAFVEKHNRLPTMDELFHVV
jgi:hypothetical protein